MKIDNKTLWKIWIWLSLVIGWALCFIPWGDPQGVHGQGMPFSVLVWLRPEGYNAFIDFPSPLGFVLNPLVVFLCGSIVLFPITWWKNLQDL